MLTCRSATTVSGLSHLPDAVSRVLSPRGNKEKQPKRKLSSGKRKGQRKGQCDEHLKQRRGSSRKEKKTALVGSDDKSATTQDLSEIECSYQNVANDDAHHNNPCPVSPQIQKQRAGIISHIRDKFNKYKQQSGQHTSKDQYGADKNIFAQHKSSYPSWLSLHAVESSAQ